MVESGTTVGFHCSISESMKMAHDKQLALVPWPDCDLDETPIATISDWVLQKIEEVCEVLGLSFDGLKYMAWELFVELEKRAVVRNNNSCKGGGTNNMPKCPEN